MRNFIVFFLLLASNAFAGDISGKIYMEKTNSALSRTPVPIHVYKDNYEFSGAETTTNTSGHYTFPNLDTAENYSYIVYPIYQGINYPYKEVAFEKNKSITLNFPISESTGSTADISVDEAIYFEFGKKDIWKVTHEMTVENKGDLLYHSDRSDAQPILFSLLNGGFDLSYLDGVSRNNSKIDDDKDTLQVFISIPPHEKTKLKFSYYYLPLERHVAFNQDAYLQRSNVTLYFKNNVRIASTLFQSDPMMLQGKEGFTRAFTSGPIKANDKIKFDIRGFFLQGDLLHIILIAACLAFIIAIIIWAFSQKKKIKNNDEQLVKKMQIYLIDLKKMHRQGTIDEQTYKKQDHRVRNFLFQSSKKITK